MDQFIFLKTDFSIIYKYATKAEQAALSDPRGACFWARLALETTIKWLYTNEPFLARENLILRETTLAQKLSTDLFYQLVGPTLTYKARYVKDQGNRAAHDHNPITRHDSTSTVSEFFHIAYWLARTYNRSAKPAETLQFDPTKLEETLTITASTVSQIQEMRKELDKEEQLRREAERKQLESEEGRRKAEEELAAIRAEVEALRLASQKIPDRHNYDEATTRSLLIDLLLKEAGWSLEGVDDQEFLVAGMPNSSGQGRVDYVLWGDDGKPLALVEAKSTRKDAKVGQHQAKLYADCLEKTYGQRPLIFCTNGYEHWLWDDHTYPPRQVEGFFKKDEIERIIQRRQTCRPLAEIPVSTKIVDRFYQIRAIGRVGESFEQDHRRKALLVMATGTGKTRTTIALIDQLMRANRIRNVLFLADRIALVEQAERAFREHLPTAPLANLLKISRSSTNTVTGAHVIFSTYQSMISKLEEMDGDIRRFGPGHFDLIIVDEAHRSIYRKYKALFSYFDSLLIGLTATPRDEIDRDTYQLFDLKTGTPTDVYDLEDAIADGMLVPPEGIASSLRLPRDGLRYDELSDEEKEQWAALEWGDEGDLPTQLEGSDFNKSIFNADTIDLVIEQLMTEGIHVENGNKLGKTIIFARSSRHAQAIIDRFNINYPELKGHFAQQIDYSISHAQSLIDDFSKSDSDPQIAVSVDMLDTGIDIPEIVNLVFFRPVYSHTKFWQMIGRGTRLCPDLFGPGEDKICFRIFDYYDNLKTFNTELKRPAVAPQPSLNERLFCSRLDLLAALETAQDQHTTLQNSLKTRLRNEVQALNPNNVLVRPHLRVLKHFQSDDAWATLSAEDRTVLANELAALPTAFREPEDNLPAKQFDLLIIRGQLTLLQKAASFVGIQKQICQVASALEGLANIPLVKHELPLISKLQDAAWWEGITVDMLEDVRCRLRTLVQLIETKTNPILYTSFQDERGPSEAVSLTLTNTSVDKNRFKRQVRKFLDAHLDHTSLLKIRRGEPLTQQDLQALKQLLQQGDLAMDDTVRADIEAEGGLVRFLRSLTGLDRVYARRAFDNFIQNHQPLTADQIEFLELVISSLCENGFLSPTTLFESPFTDINKHSISGLFGKEETQTLLSIVRSFEPVTDKTTAAPQP